MNEELENNTEEALEVEVKSVKQQLTTVTTFSRYLALALFITLPFVGGWIGYQYAPDKVVEVHTFSIKDEYSDKKVFHSNEWVTMPLCESRAWYDSLHTAITFPVNMGMKVSENNNGTCYNLAYEFQPYIRESEKEDISIFLLDDFDLNYMSFIKREERPDYDVFSLYVSDGKNQKLSLIESTKVEKGNFAGHNSVNEHYDRGRLIVDGESRYLVYKWWNDTRIDSVYKVFSLQENKIVYEDSCIKLGRHLGAGGIFQSTLDSGSIRNGTFVYQDCDGKIITTDFSDIQTVLLPASVVEPILIEFITGNKIEFVDLADGSEEAMTYPVYSVNLDGSGFREEEGRGEYSGF